MGFRDYPREIIFVLRHYWKEITEGELRFVAASLAFVSILGLVPFLAVSLATFHWIGGSERAMPKIENLLLFHFKVAAGSETIKILKTAIRNIHAQTLGVASALFLFLTAIQLLSFMEDGIRRVWGDSERRPVVQKFFIYVLLIVLWPILLATYLAFMSLEELSVVRRLIPAMVMDPLILIMALFTIYKLVPVEKVRTKFALISSVIAAGGLFALQNSFRFLAKKVFHYSNIYGGFAAIPLFLLWLLIVWYVILGGVAVCAALQKRHRD